MLSIATYWRLQTMEVDIKVKKFYSGYHIVGGGI